MARLERLQQHVRAYRPTVSPPMNTPTREECGCAHESRSCFRVLLCCYWSLADFLSDLWLTRHEGASNTSNILHHVIGITLMNAGVISVARSEDNVGVLMLLTELSTVLLDVSWLLRTFGMHKSRVYNGVMLAFATAFFVLRVVMIPVFVRHLRNHVKPLWRRLGRAGPGSLAVLILLQWFWFVKIVQKVAA